MYKDISKIGNGIPNKFHGITKLFLSNNNISSLSGIEVFTNLTQLSVSFNNLEKVDELDKIFNKNLMEFLSVKGNFFCKNPISSLSVINKFPRLKDLDGFKISESTLKVIEESKKTRIHIIPFLFVLSENINKLEKLSNTLHINLEIEEMFNSNSISTTIIEDKIKKYSYLLKMMGVFSYSEDIAKKYLNKNINPSVYVIKKIIDKFLPSKTYLIDNFIPTDKNLVCQIYEKLFADIIKLYSMKKNYNELPCYLNYLVLKSHPMLEKFFLKKVLDTNEFANDKNEIDLLKYVCKNFDQLFIKYTNYGAEVLLKLQMAQFFFLQPPQAKIISEYHPLFENDDQYELRFKKDNKTFNDNIIDIGNNRKCNNQWQNPFKSRLNQACDIYPKKDFEFVKKTFDYDYVNSFSELEIVSFFEEGREKINIDAIYHNLILFLNNYSPLEFPIFCMNFDYMRTLTSIIQDKLNEFVFAYGKILNIFQQIGTNNKNKISGNSPWIYTKQYESKLESMHDDHEIKMEASEKTDTVSKPKTEHHRINRSQKEDVKTKQQSKSCSYQDLLSQVNIFKNYLRSKSNTKSHQIPNNEVTAQLIPKNIKENLIGQRSLTPRLRKNKSSDRIERIVEKQKALGILSCLFYKLYGSVLVNQMKMCSSLKKIKVITTILQQIDYNFHKRIKRYFFFYLLKLLARQRQIENFILQRQILVLRKTFLCLKSTVNKHHNAKTFHNKSVVSKGFYSLLKRHIHLIYKRKKNSQSRVFYYRKLMKKVLLSFKFYRHLHSPKQSQEEYSKVFSFFHDTDYKRDASIGELYCYSGSDEVYDAGNTNQLECKYSNIKDNPERQLKDKKYNYEYQINTNSYGKEKIASLMSELELRYKELSKDGNNQRGIVNKKSQMTKKDIDIDSSKNFRSKLYGPDYEARKMLQSTSSLNSTTYEKKKTMSSLCPYCYSKIPHSKCSGNNNVKISSSSLNL